MSAMEIVWTVIGVLFVAAVIAFAVWMRRLDRDNFDQGTGDTMTDEQRRINQIGIGLSGGSGAQLGGH